MHALDRADQPVQQVALEFQGLLAAGGVEVEVLHLPRVGRQIVQLAEVALDAVAEEAEAQEEILEEAAEGAPVTGDNRQAESGPADPATTPTTTPASATPAWRRFLGAGIMPRVAVTLLGVPSALSLGGVKWLSHLSTLDKKPQGFLDLMNFIWGNIALAVGAQVVGRLAEPVVAVPVGVLVEVLLVGVLGEDHLPAGVMAPQPRQARRPVARLDHGPVRVGQPGGHQAGLVAGQAPLPRISRTVRTPLLALVRSLSSAAPSDGDA